MSRPQQNSEADHCDQLLKQLFEHSKIFNWTVIAKEINARFNLGWDAIQCKDRYVQKCSPASREEWCPDEQRQLYRLHDQNGNKWAIISLNMIGRSDNCVKNHFYSKMRKSLRTINKLAKLHLKKEVKEISDLVLYKLTEVTDETLKKSPDVSKEISQLSFDLKRKLYEYDNDQCRLQNSEDYSFEKQLLKDLSYFSKSYKKKPKREKFVLPNTYTSKKSLDVAKTIHSSNKETLSVPQSNSEDKEHPQKMTVITRNSQKKHKKNSILPSVPEFSRVYSSSNPSNLPSLTLQETQSHRKTLNYVIHAPYFSTFYAPMSQSQPFASSENKFGISPNNDPHHLQMVDLSLCRDPSFRNKASIMSLDSALPSLQTKMKSNVQDILKAEGILENGEYGSPNNENYIRRTNSARSFSMCSESSNPDMFGEGVVYLADFKEVSEMENSCQFFVAQQNQ